jgi:type VI secretion system secreted protein Hcp
MALVDFFLKIDSIEGESTDDKHKNEIDVISWEWGETNNAHALGGGSGAGKVQMQDFNFTMKFNKASPKLALACATGQHLKSAILTSRKAGGDQQEYLVITFSDVMVSSYKTDGTADSAVPDDHIALNFSSIKMDYKIQKPDGSLSPGATMGYDARLNKKL